MSRYFPQHCSNIFCCCVALLMMQSLSRQRRTEQIPLFVLQSCLFWRGRQGLCRHRRRRLNPATSWAPHIIIPPRSNIILRSPIFVEIQFYYWPQRVKQERLLETKSSHQLISFPHCQYSSHFSRVFLCICLQLTRWWHQSLVIQYEATSLSMVKGNRRKRGRLRDCIGKYCTRDVPYIRHFFTLAWKFYAQKCLNLRQKWHCNKTA